MSEAARPRDAADAAGSTDTTGATADAVVALRDVGVGYGATRVLTGIDLELAPGRIAALLGANGAGKSTLIKALSGVAPQYTGTISIDGAEVRLTTPQAAMRHGVATVHQKIADQVVPGLTVADNLLLSDYGGGDHGGGDGGRGGGRGGGGGGRPRLFVSTRGTVRRARGVLEVLDLPWSDRLLRTDAARLSISDAQLLVLARALRTRPRLLILDEPTSTLTAPEVERLFGVLRRLRAQGLAILYVSHRFGEVETLADRVLVLRDGALTVDADRPFDWQHVLQQMLGRRDPLAAAVTDVRRGADAVLTVRDVPLLPGAAGIDLDVRGGEVLGVLGLIGAGKTELAETLAGARPAASGAMTLDGAPHAPAHPQAAIRAGVVLVPEDRQAQAVLPGWSVARTITAPFLTASSGSLGVLVRGRERQRAQRVVDGYGVVADGLDASIDDLSGGNQQKAVVGRWLDARPRVAVLDEPFRGVDIGARRDIGAALRRLTADGAAGVLLSSDVDEALETADRVVVLVEGRIVLDAYADEVDRSAVVASLLGERTAHAGPGIGADDRVDSTAESTEDTDEEAL